MDRDLIFESFRNCISSKKCDGCEWKACKVLQNKKVGVPIDLALAVTAVMADSLKEQDAVVAHWNDDTADWIEGNRDGIDPHTRTTGEMIDTFRCSWCGFYQYWKTPFCPNCGAKMKGR